MAEVYLDVEWGGLPFIYADSEAGEPAWPSPLMRPLAWQPEWTEEAYGPKMVIPDELLNRWHRVQAELIEVQAELTGLGKDQGIFG